MRHSLKKKISITYITIYIVLCLLPLAFMWTTKDTSDTEKRELSSFPAFVKEGKINSAFSTEFDTWISEHMGFRSLLVNAQSGLKSAIFKESSEDSIVLGKNGWLFYAQTIDDYCNIATVSDRGINSIAISIKMMQDYCNEQNIDFVFTVAPNKNTLYGDNMPARYLKLDAKGNLELLTEALAAQKVNYADLVAAFSAENKVLYQERDSHWTYEGGMLMYRTLVQKLKVQKNLFEGLSYTAKNDWDADLVNMIYPNAKDDDLQLYPNLDYTYETKREVTNDEALTINAFNNNAEQNLLMFRDSFGNTTWRYFAEVFATSEFSRAIPYRLNSVSRLKANVVILEIVERNIPNLAMRTPVMQAKETASLEAKNAGSASVTVTEAYGMQLVNGIISGVDLGDWYKPVVKCLVNGEEKCFEAFPIFDQPEKTSAELCDTGFSCYLQAEDGASIEVLGLYVCGEGYEYFVKAE